MNVAKTIRSQTGPLAQAGLVSLWGASSLIKSRQQGYVTLGAATPGNTTISSVDMANSIVFYNGWYHNITSGSRPRDSWCRIFLQSATNVRASMDTAGTGVDGVIFFTVIEFMPGVIKLIQRAAVGITNASGSGAATITGVNLSKTFLTYDGFEYTGTEAYASTDPKNWLAYAYLSDATTVTVNRPGTSNAYTTYNQIVEFF